MITDEQLAAFKNWQKTAKYPHDPLATFVAGIEYQSKLATQQEPRYWVHDFGDGDGGEEFFDHPTGSDCPDCVPLYLHPAPAQPVRLTENEVMKVLNSREDFTDDGGRIVKVRGFANAIMDKMIEVNK